MGNSQVLEVDNVQQATRRLRAGLLSSPLVQVALLAGIIFVGATAMWGLEFGLRVGLVASVGPALGLLMRRWLDRTRKRHLFPAVSRAEQREERRIDLPLNVATTVMVLVALFAVATNIGGFEFAARAMAPIALPMPVVFLVWYWQSR
jgi:hypothetical protein